MSAKTEIFSRTVGSAEFPTDLSPQMTENIGRTAVANPEPIIIPESTSHKNLILETSDIIAN